MNALRTLHAALTPGAILVDTQPVSARPPVIVDGAEAGTLDMRAWSATIATIDRRTEEAVGEGLFALESERAVVVSDFYDSGQELVDTTADWMGTTVPPEVASRLATVAAMVELRQDVRVRIYRALSL